MTKITVSNANKIAMKFIISEITPPPLRKFSENSSIFEKMGFPYLFDDTSELRLTYLEACSKDSLNVMDHLSKSYYLSFWEE